MLLCLPPEIIERIIYYCSTHDLQNLSPTCTELNQLVRNDLFKIVRVPAAYIKDQTQHQELNERVSQLTTTQVLRIFNPNVPASTFKIISNLPSLIELNLRGNRATHLDISTLCIGLNHQQLEVLNLSYIPNTDKVFVFVQKLHCLRELVLQGCRISNVGLSRLHTLVKLRKLCLRHCEFSDLALYRLSAFTSLTELDLGVCRNITDVGIMALAGLTSLEHLNLSYCQVSGLGLGRVASLRNLKMLNLSHCPLLTEFDVISVVADLPKLNILVLGRLRISNESKRILQTNNLNLKFVKR